MSEGSGKAADNSGEVPELDVDDPTLTRWDLVKESARRNGVEIVHYEPRFSRPGTKDERRIERIVASFFLMTGAMATAFVVIYIFWPWEYKHGYNINKWYTPLLGLTLGLALAGIGLAVITYAKKLLPEEVAIQERHDEPSPPDDRKVTGATLASFADETQIKRRPLIKGAAALGLAPVGLAAVVPLGALIKDPKDKLFHTAWKPGLRMIREDGTPVRPEEVSVGGQLTVFPAVPGGTTNEHADSPTLLIHLRAEDAAVARRNSEHVSVNRDAQWGNFVAYSKICTHAGCPASLFEQQTNKLLCPCHQSQFLVTDNARPIFGPATRRLPQLPIEVDGEGFFVAKSDYAVPIGPGFWERP